MEGFLFYGRRCPETLKNCSEKFEKILKKVFVGVCNSINFSQQKPSTTDVFTGILGKILKQLF